MGLEKKELKYSELKIGMKVFDDEWDAGIVTDIEDKHNVTVKYLREGEGYYCLDDKCKEYSPLYKRKN